MCLNTLPPIMGLLLIGEPMFAGLDVRILERTGQTVAVTGIGNRELPGIDIVTCTALLNNNHGKVILIMHEYAYYGRGNTIHSPGQIEWFQNTCDIKSFHVGGTSYHLLSWVCHPTPVKDRSHVYEPSRQAYIC